MLDDDIQEDWLQSKGSWLYSSSKQREMSFLKYKLHSEPGNFVAWVPA